MSEAYHRYSIRDCVVSAVLDATEISTYESSRISEPFSFFSQSKTTKLAIPPWLAVCGYASCES